MGRKAVVVSFDEDIDGPIIKRMSRGTLSSICRQAIRVWGNSSRDENELKSVIEKERQEEEEHKAKRKQAEAKLKEIQEEHSQLEKELLKRKEKEEQEAERRRKNSEFQAALMKEAMEVDKKARDEKQRKIDLIYSLVKNCTNFRESFARRFAEAFVERILPKGGDLFQAILDSAKTNGYIFDESKYNDPLQEEANVH